MQNVYNHVLMANIVNHHRIQHQSHPLYLHRIAAACCVCTLHRQPRGRRHPHQTPWCTKADLHRNYNLSLLHRPNRVLQNNNQKKVKLTSRTVWSRYFLGFPSSHPPFIPLPIPMSLSSPYPWNKLSSSLSSSSSG